MKRGLLLVALCLILILIFLPVYALTQRQGKTVITDLQQWNHPSKGVFLKNGFVLERVELLKGNTYPVFIVKSPILLKNDEFLSLLLHEVAFANAFWDYEIVDRAHNETILIQCDREQRKIVNVKKNGLAIILTAVPQKHPFDLLEAQGEKLKNFLYAILPEGLYLKKVLSGDINHDGKREVIAGFAKTHHFYDIYLNKLSEVVVLQKDDSGNYVKLGSLKPGSFGQINNISLISLDRSKERFIYVALTNGFSGNGFNLYNVEGNRLISIDSEFPANGSGFRGFVDNDGDGIWQKVSVSNLCDTQGRKETVVFTWDGEMFTQGKTVFEYANESCAFQYPKNPSKLIETYIEACLLGIAQEVREMTADSMVRSLDLTPYFNLGKLYSEGFSELFNDRSVFLVTGDYYVREVHDPQSKRAKPVYFTLARLKDRWKVQEVSLQKPEKQRVKNNL